MATGGYGRVVAIRCQAVDSGARKPPLSGDRWLPSGDRWLRSSRSHPLPSGGQRREKTSTVWRQVATIWRQVTTLES